MDSLHDRLIGVLWVPDGEEGNRPAVAARVAKGLRRAWRQPGHLQGEVEQLLRRCDREDARVDGERTLVLYGHKDVLGRARRRKDAHEGDCARATNSVPCTASRTPSATPGRGVVLRGRSFRALDCAEQPREWGVEVRSARTANPHSRHDGHRGPARVAAAVKRAAEVPEPSQQRKRSCRFQDCHLPKGTQ